MNLPRPVFTVEQAELGHWPILVPGDDRGHLPKFTLNRPVCVIGSRARVHLPLPSRRVSKAHAIIIQDFDGVYIRDLASTNHLWVNRKQVHEVMLADGDLVRIGPFTLRCAKGFDVPEADFLDSRAPASQLLCSCDTPQETQHVPITGRTLLIGSRDGCDIIAEGDEVASAHAIIFERGGKHLIRDLDTATGTFVNGVAVREVALSAEDVIQVSGHRIRYLQTEATTGAASGPVSEAAEDVETASVSEANNDAETPADDDNEETLCETAFIGQADAEAVDSRPARPEDRRMEWEAPPGQGAADKTVQPQRPPRREARPWRSDRDEPIPLAMADDTEERPQRERR